MTLLLWSVALVLVVSLLPSAVRVASAFRDLSLPPLTDDRARQPGGEAAHLVGLVRCEAPLRSPAGADCVALRLRVVSVVRSAEGQPGPGPTTTIEEGVAFTVDAGGLVVEVAERGFDFEPDGSARTVLSRDAAVASGLSALAGLVTDDVVELRVEEETLSLGSRVTCVGWFDAATEDTGYRARRALRASSLGEMRLSVSLGDLRRARLRASGVLAAIVVCAALILLAASAATT